MNIFDSFELSSSQNNQNNNKWSFLEKSSFEIEVVRKKKIAMNNFRLNSIISLIFFLLQLLPFYFPWYSEPY